jgi:hypothetical protein
MAAGLSSRLCGNIQIPFVLCPICSRDPLYAGEQRNAHRRFCDAAFSVERPYAHTGREDNSTMVQDVRKKARKKQTASHVSKVNPIQSVRLSLVPKIQCGKRHATYSLSTILEKWLVSWEDSTSSTVLTRFKGRYNDAVLRWRVDWLVLVIRRKVSRLRYFMTEHALPGTRY